MHNWGRVVEQGVAGRRAARALRKHQRDSDPSNHITDSRKTAHEPLGVPRLWFPHSWPTAPPVLCVPHPHTFPPHDQLPVHTLEGCESEPLQMATERMQKVSHLWGIRRKHMNLGIQHSPRESKQEVVSFQSGFAALIEGIQS